MSSLNRYASIAILVATGATVSYGHLPSVNDASLQMGRTGFVTTGPEDLLQSRAAANVTYKNRGEWKPDLTYQGDYENTRGDTVWYGEFKGQKLWWWAKFSASGEGLKPGFFAPQGGTSPWVLINSLSALETGTVNYQWNGWNGQMENMTGLDAQVPTWRDGAVGAYSFTHDDIGAMPFDISVKPGWDLAKEYPDIKQSWGVYVEKMEAADWENAKAMVLDGHEMFNHSMEHTSAADQWQWFRPGQVVPSHDPAIPEEIRGLTVVGTWGDPAAAPAYPVKTGGTKVFESPMVAIQATHYWTQNAPTAEQAGDTLRDNAGKILQINGGPWIVQEPVVYPKAGVEEITLATGQKQFVQYGGTSNGGTNEGYIAATGATWYESKQLDEFGGQYWKPATPAAIGEPPTFISGKGYGTKAGSVWGFAGKYYRCEVDNPHMDPTAKDWEGNNKQWSEIVGYDPTTPVMSTEGTYVGGKWSSSTANVARDKGAPGFVAKVFCVEAWQPKDYKLNIQDASDIINANLYEDVVTAGEHFRKGKRVEYYGYPFDAYSEVTHDSLENAGFVGARGGAKSGRPIPGDFFHPYRIDFDAFYITKSDWTVANSGEAANIYPDNPHVLLGLNGMVDEIIKEKGYMIREFHSVCDIADGEWYNTDPSEQWPINSAAKKVGGWWGGITVNQLRAHYDYVQTKIEADELTIYTVGEVTKYRMTANVTTGATIVPAGDNYTLTATTSKDIDAKYRDEISVIVSLDQAVDSLGVNYKNIDENWGASPRRRPRKMDTEGNTPGKIWSVSINPFLGAAEIVPNGSWGGQDKVVSIETNNHGVNSASIASFAGIQNGHVALNLPAGNFTAQLFNAQGRIIGSADVVSNSGLVKTNLTTSNVATGIYYLNVTASGAQVMPAAKIMIR